MPKGCGPATALTPAWLRGPAAPSLGTSTPLRSSPNRGTGRRQWGGRCNCALRRPPWAMEKTRGVWVPARLAGQPAALLLSRVELKPARKRLAEGWVLPGGEAADGGLRRSRFRTEAFVPSRSHPRGLMAESTRQDAVPIFNLL